MLILRMGKGARTEEMGAGGARESLESITVLPLPPFQFSETYCSLLAFSNAKA